MLSKGSTKWTLDALFAQGKAIRASTTIFFSECMQSEEVKKLFNVTILTAAVSEADDSDKEDAPEDVSVGVPSGPNQDAQLALLLTMIFEAEYARKKKAPPPVVIDGTGEDTVVVSNDVPPSSSVEVEVPAMPASYIGPPEYLLFKYLVVYADMHGYAKDAHLVHLFLQSRGGKAKIGSESSMTSAPVQSRAAIKKEKNLKNAATSIKMIDQQVGRAEQVKVEGNARVDYSLALQSLALRQTGLQNLKGIMDDEEWAIESRALFAEGKDLKAQRDIQETEFAENTRKRQASITTLALPAKAIKREKTTPSKQSDLPFVSSSSSSSSSTSS